MAPEEMKSLIEQGNKTIEAIRSEAKAADAVQAEKIARMEASLASNLQEKAALEMQTKAMESRLAEIEAKASRPGAGFESKAVDEHKAAFLEVMRKGANGAAADRLMDLQAKAADVRVATAASGGYALPKEIASEIARVAIDISPIRQIARVVSTGTTDYHEIVDLGGLGYEWLGETDTRNQTDTPNFADVMPTFGEISAKPEATRASISDLFFDVEGWLVEQAAIKFSQGEGAAFVSGNGTNKPTGFLAGTPVATGDAARAFGVLQYLATGQAAALATNPFDTFKDILFTLKAAYRANANWVMNSLTMAQLAKVKDSTGQYLLTPAVTAGAADMISSKPITIAEDMPNIAANALPIAVGDFKQGYLIADIPGMWMVRDEITKPGWVKLPTARRVGGKLKDTNAIKLVKIAAA
jgi:HK97 family phage major capsid protein